MMPHAAGSAVNQHAGPRPDASRLDQCLPGRQRRLRSRRGLFVRNVQRFEGEVFRRYRSELGIGAARPGEIDRSEDRIADAELLDALPRFRHDTRKIPSEDHRPLPTQGIGDPAAPTRLDVDRIHTGGFYRDEYLAPLRNGGGNRRHGETLRSAETFENHRFHNGNFMLSTGNAIRPLRLGNAGVGKTEAAVVNGKGVRPAVPASKDFS